MILFSASLIDDVWAHDRWLGKILRFDQLSTIGFIMVSLFSLFAYAVEYIQCSFLMIIEIGQMNLEWPNGQDPGGATVSAAFSADAFLVVHRHTWVQERVDDRPAASICTNL